MPSCRRFSLIFLAFMTACAATPEGAHPPDARPGDGGAGEDVDGGIDAPAGECQTRPELCNGIDDNCNDMIDEEYPDLGDPCTSGQGACARNGVIVCTGDGLDTECSAAAGTPGVELCANGIDDDCDGQTDEGFDMAGLACTAGQGACKATGIWACSGDKTMLSCSAMAGMPGPAELCGNSIDDDCDGQTDEGFEDVGALCDGPDADLCPEGIVVCSANQLSTECSDNSATTPDLCNGDDDDCNPDTPDGSGDPNVGTLCDSLNDSDTCEEGNRACLDGGLVCTDPGDDDLNDDALNCGACGHNCTQIAGHGTIRCTGGTCDPICNQGYQSCDADLDDGCETSRFSGSTCPAAVDWGSIIGDGDGHSFTKTGLAATWAHFLVHEDKSTVDDLQVKLTLTNPAGARFGMRARCYSCGDTNYRKAEPLEQNSASFYFGAGDEAFTDDDFDLFVEVYFISNSSRTCNLNDDKWIVKVEQTEDTSLRDCENNYHD